MDSGRTLRFGKVGLLAVFACMATAPVGLAQSASPGTTPAASTQAADLRVLPRLGIGHTSSGGGFDGFSQFEGFVPLLQTPGQNLLFLEGRLLLDNSANVGGNLLLGYRTYSAASDRTFGGYVSYDNRNTGNSVFSQIGVGLESLGQRWDVRANAYFPVGDTRQVVAESLTNGGFQPTNLRFQDHFLLVGGQQEQRATRLLEAAMGGFDLEAGTRLLAWGSGDLRGYGGLYYYDASGSPSTWGWRLRLEGRPTDGLRLGLAVQGDDLFGTQVIASLGLSLPGVRPSGAKPRTTLARLGETVGRSQTIVVDDQLETQIISQSVPLTLATNPATGQPYFFQHVNLGVAGGNGTFENPFGTVQNALTATRSDGNDVVYVQAGTNPGIPALTIPNRVQVLSTGPVQRLNTVEFGLAQLPLSGTGVLPTVTNTVTLGSNSVLSGFAITGTTGPGVAASGITNAVVQNSTIASSSNPAVFLSNTTGTISFSDSTIASTGTAAIAGSNMANLTLTNTPISSTNSAQDGLSLNGVTGTVSFTNSPITIANSAQDGLSLNGVAGTVSFTSSPITIAGATGDGIAVNNVSGTVTLPTGTVTQTGAFGVNLTNSTGTIAVANFRVSNTGDSGIAANGVGNLTLQSNQIQAATNQGILVRNGTTNLTIADNTVSNTVGGSASLGPITLPGGGSSITVPTPLGTITIPAPTGVIPLPTGQGIVVATADGTVNVTRNTIAGTASQGLVLLNASGPVSVTDNSISNTVGNDFPVTLTGGTTVNVATGQGIVLSGVTGSLEVSRNQVSNVRGQGLLVAGATQTVNLTGNTIDRTVDQGLVLAGTTGTVTIANNTITTVTGRNYTVPNPLGGTLDVPTGQGIALAGISGTVNVTGNTISGVTGFQAGGLSIPSGQGIGLANGSGQVDLTIAGNQIRNNFNDGLLLVLVGTANANLAILNNTIENNGGTTPLLRGDGIGIGVEQEAVANLTISGNTIRGNGDDGIDLRVNLFTPASPARLTGTISNNTIANNGQNGLEFQTFSTNPTPSRLTIDNNTITTPNAFQGILLQTLVPTARLSATVNSNTLSNTTNTPGFAAQNGPLGQLCLSLSGNNSNRGYQLQNGALGTFQVVNLAALTSINTGLPVTTIGNIITAIGGNCP